MSEQITVGYDTSSSSVEAVRWAADEAASRGVRLKIVSCFEVPVGGEAIFGWSATEAFESLLKATGTGLLGISQVVAEAHPGLEFTIEACPGPASATLGVGVESGDLVVVGASRHDGTAAFWLGSTPRHLVQHSSCPVVVVRGPASRGKPQRIVVGVDGSEASDAAIRWAGQEADRHRADLVVLHGWTYPYPITGADSAQARDLTQVDAACVLDRAVESAREQFAAPVTGLLVESRPFSALLDTVRDGDLLVLGSRGRGAVMSRLFGSTDMSVLVRCAVPVVVVRSVGTREAKQDDGRAIAVDLESRVKIE